LRLGAKSVFRGAGFRAKAQSREGTPRILQLLEPGSHKGHKDYEEHQAHQGLIRTSMLLCESPSMKVWYRNDE
jgi:hypothetical protein